MNDRRNFLKGGAIATAAGVLGGGEVIAQTRASAAPSYAGANNFASTATPRMWTKPQRAGPPISIDVHTHWAPAAYLKAKADLGQPDFLPPTNYDLAARAKSMDESGVQIQVLTLGGFRPWVWVTPEQGAHIARVSNDEAIAAHKAFPTRFYGGIELNASDPVGALAELNRCAGQPGMVCAHLPTSLGGKDFLYDDAFQPIFARAQELKLPILMHPLDGEANWFGGKRLADKASGVNPNANAAANRFPGLTNSLGNSLEVATTMAKLIASGTMDRYPDLIFIMGCSSGALPYMGGRLENRGGGGAGLKMPIYQYMRRFYYDSLVYWPPALRYLAEMVGSDRIVLGTDNMGPGNGMTAQPHSVIDQAGFSETDRDLILRGNLRRILRI